MNADEINQSSFTDNTYSQSNQNGTKKRREHMRVSFHCLIMLLALLQVHN